MNQSRTATPASRLLPTVLPSLVIGIFSSLLLIVVSEVADRLKDLLWTAIPQAIGQSGSSAGWIVLILTLSGVGVGLVIWKVPGHAGPDPATTGLVEKPLALAVLPSLLLALILMLAGGVSLGPENPIMAIDIGLVAAVGARFLPRVGVLAWVGLASSGMIGAMFGTPIAAALLLSESAMGDTEQPLWDRLFAPLVAAGAGAITTDLLTHGQLSLAIQLPAYDIVQLQDLLIAAAVASIGAIIGMGTVHLFRLAHPIFHRVDNPLLMLTVGGLLLGVLGVIGGPITLFKGLDQMKELTQDAAQYTPASMAVVTVVKLAALVIGATSGFRGGRIFPSVFAGVALGLCISLLVPAFPPALVVSSALLGVLLAITRQGWLSFFMALAVVPNLSLIPVMTLAMLPAWLLVTGRPQMQIQPTVFDSDTGTSV